ncbi:hypothetical protein BJV78DRAFT_749836 [Lactifluus subvellereus]|nr:hypothetical protein BJV78DRAFT_749836 [Lactifluus subvellereus]
MKVSGPQRASVVPSPLGTDIPFVTLTFAGTFVLIGLSKLALASPLSELSNNFEIMTMYQPQSSSPSRAAQHTCLCRRIVSLLSLPCFLADALCDLLQ